MKALVYEGPRDMQIREVDLPAPNDEEVLIEVAFSGICGSELSGYLGHNALRKPPQIFGHEFSGTIVQLSEQLKESYSLKPGQRVTANPLVSCGRCMHCLKGQQQLCTSRKLLSASLPGSNAAYVKVPASCVYPLQDHITFQQGALTEPIACSVRVAELSAAKPGDQVLIMGMGPFGLFVLQALRVHGVKDIIAVDLHRERLQMAEALGAITLQATEVDITSGIQSLTNGLGVQVAIDAVGSAQTRRQCMDSTAPGGKVVFTGLHEPESLLQVNSLIRSEITCIGSFAYSSVNFQTALKWLYAGYFDLSDWIVEAPLEEGAEWFDKLLGNPGKVAKVLLYP
ncbi:galactitol-1-phosphate 5-dehydrogenase [Paenibacillus sp. LjRoot153]|uniref:galactitol-1-phosphate 5-dehydrogenase n=1 Tax=Paenibacillus sp. LjRoot153 TaxID=3342270 RepID=UPI003ECEE0C4